MSRTGQCHDNAVAESVFGSLKAEWCDHAHYRDLADARLSVRRYVHWFNHHRRHQSLGYRTPAEVEQEAEQDASHGSPPAASTLMPKLNTDPNKASATTPAVTVAAAG